MKYLSVCSGIEAATYAWHPLGWTPLAFSEVDKFPCAVLQHHYPTVTNWGDMTKFKEWPDANVDVLVGGTPCQSFSVAGLRKGLGDPRGNLMLTYLAIADRYRPKWVVWENVPGVLSSNRGRDFGALLGGLAELGYGFAYRVLDAQYFGVAQRRRRVFVVGCLGDWRCAAAVLFERASLSGHPAPSRRAREGIASGACAGIVGSLCADSQPGAYSGQDAYTGRLIPHMRTFAARAIGNIDTAQIARTLTRNMGAGGESQNAAFITHTLRGEGFDASEDGTGKGTPLVPVVFHPTQDVITSTERCDAIGANSNATAAAQQGMQVRRLTPRECERLQGFPDDYTDIRPNGKPTPDGPRYKAIGNSMAVPVMRWIGERIAMVTQIQSRAAA